jgi:glycerol-3-phosphate dehydrogenase (NAD(P)+)
MPSSEKDFWRKASVAVIGGGSWGTVLAHLASRNVSEVRVWMRDEESVRALNSTRANPKYVKALQLGGNVRAFSEPERIFDGGVQGVIWCLPSKVCREQARALARLFKGDEIVLHATKGIEEGSLKRVSVMLREELPAPRIGVISGPNLADEVARGEPAATVVASPFEEVVEAGQAILATDRFRVYAHTDVVGVEWAGVLKNVLAIAAGALDGLKMGWNTRSMLISRGLAEMVRFGTYLGAQQGTFIGLAGVGDLLATCSSPLSRNYRVGIGLAEGKKLSQILDELGSTAEGVRTCQSVWDFARAHGIYMPITEGVYHLILGERSVREVLDELMTRPSTAEGR